MHKTKTDKYLFEWINEQNPKTISTTLNSGHSPIITSDKSDLRTKAEN